MEVRAPKHSHSPVLNLLIVCVCPLQALGLALCAAAEVQDVPPPLALYCRKALTGVEHALSCLMTS